MNKDQLIDRIIHIQYNSPIWEIRNEPWFAEIARAITERDIEEVLVKHQEVIKEWYVFSDSQRSSPSWCFINNVPGKYCVYLHPNDGSKVEIYTNEIIACAVYIKKQIDRWIAFASE